MQIYGFIGTQMGGCHIVTVFGELFLCSHNNFSKQSQWDGQDGVLQSVWWGLWLLYQFLLALFGL